MSLIVKQDASKSISICFGNLNCLLSAWDFVGRVRYVQPSELMPQLREELRNQLNVDFIAMFGCTFPKNSVMSSLPPGTLVIFQAKEVSYRGSYILHVTYYLISEGVCKTIRYLPTGVNTEEWSLKRESELSNDIASFFIYGKVPLSER